MSGRFNVLYRGDIDDVVEVLDGDNPPEDIVDVRAALTNLMRHFSALEYKVSHLEDRLIEAEFRKRPDQLRAVPHDNRSE